MPVAPEQRMAAAAGCWQRWHARRPPVALALFAGLLPMLSLPSSLTGVTALKYWMKVGLEKT